MNITELIKKQSELEEKIDKLKDESDEIGEVIKKKFDEMSHEERMEHYDSLPCGSTKYDIFSKHFYPLIEAKRRGE
ncbi:hypothetical protein [Bacillus phage vB_BanS-Thrax5]|nr:hypothetical protein [Bacillus phage vB_BanS-Thrax5]